MQADIEPVVKNLPEIIKQASQSPLGIFALMVILIFFVAALLFQRAPVRWRMAVFSMLLGGVIVYATEINRVASKPEAVHYVGRTLDQVTHNAVPEANVLVSLGKKSNPPYFTDSLGSFSFWLARSKPTDDATVRIEHENYRPFDRIVPSDASTQLGDILLAPVAQLGNTPPAEPSPAPPATSPASDNAPPPAAAGNQQPPAQPAPSPSNAAALRARVLAERAVSPDVAERRVLVPHTAQPQAVPQLAQAAHVILPKVVEASSGQRVSGKGKNWSMWYRIQVGAAPAGYTIEKAAFWLTGDRSCGAGAECQEITKSDAEVVWQFRLQGHDEWGAPPQTYSTGTLRVTYRLK